MKATPILMIGIMTFALSCTVKPPYRYVDGEKVPVSSYALEKRHLPAVQVIRKSDSGNVAITAVLEYQALGPISEEAKTAMRRALVAELKKGDRPPKNWYTNQFNEIIKRENGLQDQVLSVLVTTSQKTARGLVLKSYSN